MQAVTLLLCDSRGVYIPRDFVSNFYLEQWNIDPESWAVKTCADFDSDCYWDAWTEILDHAEYHKDGNVWRLHQDGDLWAICYELMTDEEKSNFGFEE